VKLRGRLLTALLLVGAPPVLLLAWLVDGRVSARLEAASRTRVEATLRAARERFAALQARSAERVERIARLELREAPAADPLAADALAERQGLDVLEIVDRDGRVVASHHWPAAFGLPAPGTALSSEAGLRLEKVARGLGFSERLAVVAEGPAAWGGRPVTVRGGWFVDDSFLADMASLTGAEVAVFDAASRRLWTRPGSPLASWNGEALPAGPARGETVLAGIPYDWSAARLGGRAWLIAAGDRTELLATLRDLRRYALALLALVLTAAVLASAWLSSRLTRPLDVLADQANRIAAGELGAGTVPATNGTDEVADLARAFDTMQSELRTSQAHLVQAGRVAAWRDTARRLAHELKNPLFPIQISIETLRRAAERAGDGEADRATFQKLFAELTDTILEEVRTLRRIVDEFSSFARMPRPQLAPVQVNDVVERVLSLHEAQAGPVRIERTLATDLPVVQADADLLAKALGNLTRNALEAMPGGGVLRVETRRRPRGVEVAVTDTGPGLSPAQQAQLFKPYFTTRPGGTGLGLAIVQGIVSDHLGLVEVKSEPGAGSTFTIVLPTTGAREMLPAG
jgi:two-component system nitrogen regulation sensor histidine kinase NtrY